MTLIYKLSQRLLLVLTATSPLSAQTPLDTLRMLDGLWARAYATHDTTLAMSLFDPDLIVTSSNGTRKTREKELDDVRPFPGLAMHYFHTDDVAVRLFGDAGVVVGVAKWEFSLNNKVSAIRKSYTATYVRGGSFGWRMVGLHLGNTP